MCKSGTEANKARYKNIKNWAKKMVAKAMKDAAKWELRELSEHPDKVFKLVKSEKGWERCMKGSDGRLNFVEKDREKACKEHMERIMNEENDWIRT